MGLQHHPPPWLQIRSWWLCVWSDTQLRLPSSHWGGRDLLCPPRERTSTKTEFGVPFDETTGDGTEVRTTATLSGNSLIKDQRATKSSGVSRIETRNFKNNGQIMELVHTIPGKANIRSVRVYKKL